PRTNGRRGSAARRYGRPLLPSRSATEWRFERFTATKTPLFSRLVVKECWMLYVNVLGTLATATAALAKAPLSSSARPRPTRARFKTVALAAAGNDMESATFRACRKRATALSTRFWVASG